MLDGCNVLEDLEDILMEVDSGEPELCCADIIARIDEGQDKVLSCDGCIYKDTGKVIWMCPYGYNSMTVRKSKSDSILK